MKLFATLAATVSAHGRLMEPPGRSSLYLLPNDEEVKSFWDVVIPNYADNQLFCGGLTTEIANGYKCGVCGDNYADSRPRENELGFPVFGFLTRSNRSLRWKVRPGCPSATLWKRSHYSIGGPGHRSSPGMVRVPSVWTRKRREVREWGLFRRSQVPVDFHWWNNTVWHHGQKTDATRQGRLLVRDGGLSADWYWLWALCAPVALPLRQLLGLRRHRIWSRQGLPRRVLRLCWYCHQKW